MVKLFPKGVMVADFWRYSIMYTHGGIYADLDTIPLKAINQWQEYPFNKVGVIIGLENSEHFC